jgi:hypothetical protein
MKITTDKQQPVKLYDWLKAKQITLKELIFKKNFKSYSDLINFCDKLEMLPCSASDFERLFLELHPPKLEKVIEEVLEKEVEEIEQKIEEEIQHIEKQELEVAPQKHSRKKS